MLEEYTRKLQRSKQIIVYTDESLITDVTSNSSNSIELKRQRISFGAICLVKNLNLGRIEWKGKVEGSLSSTRAELWIILSVLWVIPNKTSIKIITDSESSIKAIKGYTNEHKGKYRSNYSNPLILQTIKELIYTKEIDLELEKIKAHQGDYNNERVDELAKLESNSGFIFSINPKYLRE
ncbi:7541_t:CDS:1 [Dentiscutata erythropus]|uniref:7541_t:CDS:1 n=1 Tax=Dentiscutata erythropus TaxID=1348616 RepID=A0A9N9JD44_9GLOM|nr:7541_t:CDS:1 [Dentiscutata erythropus]